MLRAAAAVVLIEAAEVKTVTRRTVPLMLREQVGTRVVTRPLINAVKRQWGVPTVQYVRMIVKVR
jgi:hypothetical protein